ncbi:hypothetical protein [Emticicia sp. C21]|uniref:hypothetical protein n=1 Tax=Emticicia sp. C21 TaxID=2302915 RepID=UPI000E34A786|nr:hypothetical protein [Emticicia sp. C21]RFS15104.1 hypothetical protein D0T08_18690 [Emticicia sp. C21]
MKTNRLFILGLAMIFGLAFQACEDDNEPAIMNPTISGLTCPSAVFSTNAVRGTAYTGTFTVPYTGGNGMAYTTGTGISSTGTTGLTATLNSGSLMSGGGNLTYAVTGTPSTADTVRNASFLINFGGQTCSVTMPISPANSGQ